MSSYDPATTPSSFMLTGNMLPDCPAVNDVNAPSAALTNPLLPPMFDPQLPVIVPLALMPVAEVPELHLLMLLGTSMTEMVPLAALTKPLHGPYAPY